MILGRRLTRSGLARGDQDHQRWVWHNSQGRMEGGGTTSKARQARRLAAKEKERWEAGEPLPLKKGKNKPSKRLPKPGLRGG